MVLESRESFFNKLPSNLQGLLRKEEDFSLVYSIWKLPETTIKSLLPSIPEKLHAVFDWKFTKPELKKRGKKSALPFSSDKVKLAGDLMKSKTGSTVTVEGGTTGSLVTVQVLAKVEINGKVKTVSISTIQKVD